jgi:hypothetical protein
MEHRETLRRRARLVLAAAALTVGLPACGGSGGGSVTGPSAPPARQREVINGSWRVDPLGGSGQVYYVVIDVNQTADFDATVQWTLAHNDIDIGLGSGDCRGRANDCSFLVESTSTSAKPERLARPGLAAGRYTLVIVNFGSEPDQGTYEIGLTR